MNDLFILNKIRCEFLKEKVSFHLHVKEKFQNKCNIYFNDIDGTKIFLEMRFSYFIF